MRRSRLPGASLAPFKAELGGFSWELPDAPRTILKALEQYAPECSLVKVYGSEALDYVADEGVQVHGGFGFHQDYAVERAYRDSRINRIFEGTNEINRLLITGMLLKRAARGQLPLVTAAMQLMTDIQNGKGPSTESDEELRLVQNSKRIAFLTLGLAYQRFATDIENQQEISMHIADIMMQSFAMESSMLRSRKLAAHGKSGIAADLCAVFLRDAMASIEQSARNVIGACSDSGSLRQNMSVLRRFAVYDPVNSVDLRRKIASRLLEKERYSI